MKTHYLNPTRYLEGERVKGVFHGVPYTGIVTESRPNYANNITVIQHVKFDKPVDCGPIYGVRDGGIIESFDDSPGFNHTIEKA